MYLVRYHSFYPWHTPPRGHARGYAAFAGERDWQLLPLLKLFHTADLYSKRDAADRADEASASARRERYERLVREHFPSPEHMRW